MAASDPEHPASSENILPRKDDLAGSSSACVDATLTLPLHSADILRMLCYVSVFTTSEKL